MGGGVESMLSSLRKYCYEALSVHKLGVCGGENVRSAKILLTERLIQNSCFKHVLKTFYARTFQ